MDDENDFFTEDLSHYSTERINLSFAAARRIYWDIKEEKANPVETKLLMEAFLDGGKDLLHGQSLMPYLSSWIALAFEKYLANPDPKPGDFERYLGLVAPANRPADNADHIKMAEEVFWLCMDEDITKDEAISFVASKYHKSEESVSRYWKAHKVTAKLGYAATHALDSHDDYYQWTDDQIKKLKKFNLYHGVNKS